MTDLPAAREHKARDRTLVARTADAGRAIALRLPAVALFLLVWTFAASRLANPVLLPTPWRVFDEIVLLTRDGEMARHVAASLSRLALGFGAAVLAGLATGLAVGLSRHAGRMIDPLIELTRPISAIAWIPLALYIFGIGDTLPTFIIAYAAFFPIVLNTAAGVAGVDPTLVRAARTLGVRWPTIVCQVIAPASLPRILTGVRLGVTGAFLALIAAEIVGAPEGLGFAIQWYGGALDTPSMLAIIVVVSALGFLADALIRTLQRRLTPWAIAIAEER